MEVVASMLLDVRTTTFFNVDRMIKSEDIRNDGEGLEIDIFPWKSTQRVVFTMTNPVETHQI